MQINSEFRERQPIGVRICERAHTSHDCTQDRTDYRSDLTVLNDLTVTTKMMRGK